LSSYCSVMTARTARKPAEARAIAARRLDDVRRRLADLQRIETALVQLVGQCEARRGTVRCPLIAALRPPLAPAAG